MEFTNKNDLSTSPTTSPLTPCPLSLSFVIPVLNEAESLPILYKEIINQVGANNHSPKNPYSAYEVIFIDDGSTDDSFAVMQKLAESDPNVKVIKFRRNFGKSAALHIGFKYATGDVVFTMDADLQDDPVEIPAFLEKLAQGFDMVSGWKQKRNDPLSKTLPSKFFNFTVSHSFGLKLHDYNCGFKAYHREVIKEIDVYGEMHRYIPALAHSKGFRVAEIPVNHRSRQHGVSKFGIERYLRGYLDLLTVKLNTRFSRSPLYLFGGIGTIFSGLGLLICLYLTIEKFIYSTPLSNRPIIFLAVLLIIVGLQFVSIGLIGELVVNQTRKLNKDDIISIERLVNTDIIIHNS